CFAMTQILFDLEPLAAFRDRIGGWPIPVLVGVWPIRTIETLIRVHNETPGIVVPEHIQERYRAAGPGARDAGPALGEELITGPPESPCSTRPATAVMARSTRLRPSASCVNAFAVGPTRPGIAVRFPLSG